eukprot:TRINITY_DN7562_c0_g2_i5.p1 TRINITY_DN7562_c0_g2~~TRINITY_DN7562_c0_g2_i5.p1  ORF type:complete len:220 (-),score=15.81 TRINITY_DN7562_c0_g2_i5:126-785(-)
MASTALSMSSLSAALPSCSKGPASMRRPSLAKSCASSSVCLSCCRSGTSGRSFLRRSSTRRAQPLRAFSGFSIANPLNLRKDGESGGNGLFGLLVDNGSRWFAMRHGKRVAKLGRPADQRKALLRGLVTELLRHGRIKTTRTRAKAMRKFVDHMITLAKGGSLHQRRQALGYIYDKQLVHSVFAEAPTRYSERNGGYTRIIRTMPRRGDNAPMAFIELV